MMASSADHQAADMNSMRVLQGLWPKVLPVAVADSPSLGKAHDSIGRTIFGCTQLPQGVGPPVASDMAGWL